MKKISLNFKKSLNYAFSITAGINTFIGILGYTIKDISDSLEWWHCAIILIVLFALLTFIIYDILKRLKHKPYSTKINGIPVIIKTGDIFEEAGLKVIPFNERFDTTVDDIIVAHNSLNGKMIDHYVKDIDKLNNTIKLAENDNSPFFPTKNSNFLIYPLGRVIRFENFLLLAFSHFDKQNKAYIGIGEYEQLLIRMWSEIRRTYAATPIVIPLLGSGITTIDGISSKNHTELLKCILCTLRKSGFQPNEGITIILTPGTIEKIDMNLIKEEF